MDKMRSEDLKWNKILYGYSPRLLKFLINARANTLPSPDNLVRWKARGKCNQFHCGLCLKPKATLNHILAGCKWVFNRGRIPGVEDRYTWRYNVILIVIVNQLGAYLKRL